MLQAIGDLPEDEREAFDLVRIQGMTQVEAAEVLGVSTKTVQRRLNRALLILTEELDDLRPGRRATASTVAIGACWRRHVVSEESRDGGWRPPRCRATRECWALLEEILESDRTPEEVCQDCPELLTEVRHRLRRVRASRPRSTRCSRRRDQPPTPRDPPDGRPRQLPGLRRAGDAGPRRHGRRLQGPALAASTAWSPSRC